jgi:hypothetical protein
MNKDSHFTGQPVYSQVLKLLDKEKILQLSRTTQGSEAYVKRFDGYQHLVVMLFGILKHFDSLCELEIGMKAEAHKLRHFGMDYLVRRSTLAEANIRRPQEFFASVYAYLLEKYAKFLADSRPRKSCKGQTHEPKDWEKLLYMMDSTTITLFGNILLKIKSPKSDFTKLRTGLLCSVKFYRTAIIHKENESRDWKLFQSRLSCGTIAARLSQGGRQMCLFYSASLKSTA